MAIIKGKVKWFNLKKGYGFIKAEDGSEHFVHFSGIEKGRHYTGLEENDEVTFELEETTKGPKAVKVNLTPVASHPEEKTEATEPAE